MTLALVAAGAALILVPGAMGAAAKAVTIGTRGSVASISADGGRVAIHAIDYDAGAFECYSGAVWAPATRKVVRLQDPRPCDAEERFIEYDGLALGGTRVVWMDYKPATTSTARARSSRRSRSRKGSTRTSARRSPTTRT